MPEVRRRRRSTPWRRRLRRVRRTWRDHPGRAAAWTVAALGVLWILWSLFVAWTVSQQLAEVRERAVVMRAALVRADADGARTAMAAYQEAAASAHRWTSGWTWSSYEALPVLGDDAQGIATVAEVLDGIGQEGLPPIADAAEQVTAESFRPIDGVFPEARIRAIEEPARESEAAFEAAAAELAKVDSGDFAGPVRSQYDQLEQLVDDARSTLGSVYRAARVIPRMMGNDRPRYYLMVLQNNAELRSGGGLPGALSLVRMRQGEVEIVEQEDMADLGLNTDPVVTLTAEEKRVFGRILGLAAVDATLTPDFVRSAEIIRARWERDVGGRLDGMFFVDPVAVSYLLAGTGSVDVPGYQPVSSKNVVRAVENDIYRLTDVRTVHSDYQQAVAKAVFDAFAAGRGDTPTAIRGLVAGVAEGRIRMHSFDPIDQAEIEGTQIAGEFSDTASADADVGIFLNDGGPTKMQFYLRYDARVVARSCVESRQVISGSIEFHSDTPADVDDLPASITGEGFPGVRVRPGDQLIVAYVTTPVGGEILDLSIDGQPVVAPVVEPLAGRDLARIGVLLAPQERHRVDFTMRTAKGQVGPINLSVTPGAFAGSPNGRFMSACTVR